MSDRLRAGKIPNTIGRIQVRWRADLLHDLQGMSHTDHFDIGMRCFEYLFHFGRITLIRDFEAQIRTGHRRPEDIGACCGLREDLLYPLIRRILVAQFYT